MICFQHVQYSVVGILFVILTILIRQKIKLATYICKHYIVQVLNGKYTLSQGHRIMSVQVPERYFTKDERCNTMMFLSLQFFQLKMSNGEYEFDLRYLYRSLKGLSSEICLAESSIIR
jgi:hypothetical protein